MMSPRRPSRIPRPAFGKLHLGWQRVLAALRGAGLARDLDPHTIKAWLGVSGEHAPTQAKVFALLDAYYRGDDDLAAGPRRRLEDRFVAHRAGDGAAARQTHTPPSTPTTSTSSASAPATPSTPAAPSPSTR
jgi:hypothetical protein